MSSSNYKIIIEHYENCLAKFGDSHLGVDWPNAHDAAKRYSVMLDLISYNKDDAIPTLLDFGCGTAGLLEFIQMQTKLKVDYAGLDISEKFVEVSKSKFPENIFYNIDILKNPRALPSFDFIVMNGVFTERRELPFDDMFEYCKNVLITVFEKAKIGIAFNVMSKHVDWERDELFHMPHDLLSNFIIKELSRNYIIRNDYGLYEYTVYVFKQPTLL